MDQVTYVCASGVDFVKSSMRLIRKSTKPNLKEYKTIATATAFGIAIMGFIGNF